MPRQNSSVVFVGTRRGAPSERLPQGGHNSGFTYQIRNVCSRETQSQLLSAQTQAIDPLGGHSVEVSRIEMGLFSAHEVRGWIGQLPILLAQIGQNESFDFV